MKIFKLQLVFILFVYSSFAESVHALSKTSIPGYNLILNLSCDEDSLISILTTTDNIWTESFNKSCPNRNLLQTLGITLNIITNCQNKQNCSIDFNKIQLTNCSEFYQYIRVTYTCNNTNEETTVISTTRKTDNNDDSDNDDDISEEDRSTASSTTTSTTTTTIKPSIKLHYTPLVVPQLLTTLQPTRKPNNFPQPFKPGPVFKPVPQFPNLFHRPLFRGFNNLGNNPPPMFMPLPLPAPVPIPLFG